MNSFNSYKAAQVASSNVLSPTSLDCAPKKYNLSFSFTFDGDRTSDLDNPDLGIDVAEVDDIEQPKKRRRTEEADISLLNEMEEELERQLDAKAAKTNLTATNVKNILKHVITNEHVLAMVQNRLRDTDITDNFFFEPTLTRAKAKELAKVQPNIPWPITPVKLPPSSEVQALIADELCEDSSDEEYDPDQDPQSEDDSEFNIDNLITTDIDIARLADELCEDSSDEEYDPDQNPQTKNDSEFNINSLKMTDVDIDKKLSSLAVQSNTEPVFASQIAPTINYGTDGVFKIPDVPRVLTKEESIGHRTRSKLSLSETSLEQIEQSFIPPDITTDMYEWDCDIDEEWNKFLKEFTEPLPHELNIDDDPEADPEYNILDDRECELLDKEELRMDNAVKVTRKELNDLVSELFEFEDIFSNSQIELEKSKKKKSDNTMSLTMNTSVSNMIDLIPALAVPELPKLVDSNLRLLLATQFEQHVQLMAQHFVLTYLHPDLHENSNVCRDNLNSIKILQDGPYSAFNVRNLDAAMELVNTWEAKFEDEKFHIQFMVNLNEEIDLGKQHAKKRIKYKGDLHPIMKKLFMDSNALMYPELLPHINFRPELIDTSRRPYSEPEKRLLAIGVAEFYPFVESQNRKFSGVRANIDRVAYLISTYLMPNRSTAALRSQIWGSRASKKNNSIKQFFQTGEFPSRIHCIDTNYEMKAPCERPILSLPKNWQQYVKKEKNKKYDSLESLVSDLTNSTYDIFVNKDLLTPTVNMMPSMNLRETGKKSGQSKPVTNSEHADNSNKNNNSMSDAITSQQMRKTTPRLAKTRSVQNMKLKNHVSVSKNLSNNEASKCSERNQSLETLQSSCGSTKGDNEDEIAELMLASTTIKKDTVNRKKAKQVRESENIKRMLEAEKELVQEERATKFAASFMQKLHMTLESSNPEALRSVIKLYLDYSEKLDTESVDKTKESKIKQEKIHETHDQLAINLYNGVREILKDYPEMYTDFLLFLKPHQAAMIDKLVEHTMLQKMSDFINAAHVYFAKQPSRMARVMQAIMQLASDPNVTLETVHTTMDPVLKGHPLIMDMFQQIIPHGKPPESLFAASLFENLTCPVLPHDKNRVFSEDAPEMYENFELSAPTNQDDPYGGDNCKCDCHEPIDIQSKVISEHCISCGVRYLNGRVYLQTSEGLRPAKVTFPGDDDEKLENIARVSLKTTEKSISVPATQTGRRRKSSKNDVNTDDIAQKCAIKNSPLKDKDDDGGGEKTLRSRRGAKSPPKSMERRHSKSSDITGSGSNAPIHGSSEIAPLKSKREKRAERREAKTEMKNAGIDVNSKLGHNSAIISDIGDSSVQSKNDGMDNSEYLSGITTSLDTTITIKHEIDNLNSDKFDDNLPVKIEPTTNNDPWTRQEDALLLQNMQKDYSENTFFTVSQLLGDRTVQQVKERCQTLLSLLEKMI